MARAQTIDKFYSATDLELVYSFNSFVNTLSTDGWARLSLIAFVLVVLAFYARCTGNSRLWNRSLKAIIACGAVCVIVSNILAYMQYVRYNDKSGAIIMRTTPLRTTPDTTATTIYTLHGGTKVMLTDTTLPQWSEVQLSDGRKGWVYSKDKENI